MAPKKAMKSMKVMKVMKHALGKAKATAKTKAKASTAKALGKAKLNKKSLEKLGKMSLREKINAAAEEAEDEEDAAQILKESLTKDEHSMVWGRHQTHLKKNPLEKEEHDKLGKVEKGLSAALWLMRKECKKYVHTSREVAQREKMTKEDTWESEKQMLNKFSETEFYKHIDSGRIVYRPDPTTHDVWQYKDTQSYKKETALSRGKKWESGQEFDPDQKDLEKFKQLYSVEAMALSLDDVGAWEGKGLGKGKGKGKGKALGKGKGKKGQLAILDGAVEEESEEEEEPQQSEEEALKEALKKARRARDAVASAQSDLDDALGKAKSSLSRQGKATAEGLIANMSKLGAQFKNVLQAKKPWKSDAVKELLEESVKVIKAAKDEAKELKQLANKAGSTASIKRSRI